MRFCGPLCLLLCVVGLSSVRAEPAAPTLTRQALVAAAVDSATDHIGSGWCGRGMLSVLRNAGLGNGLEGGNGQDWEKILLQAGWRPVRCATPFKAPLGSVLVYSGDRRVGKRPRGTPGGYYGHVEMVALGTAGQRLYVSDCARPLPGGTVRDNFTGRAWVPPGKKLWTTPSVSEQVATILEERKRMALVQFERNGRTQLSALKTAASITVAVP